MSVACCKLMQKWPEKIHLVATQAVNFFTQYQSSRGILKFQIKLKKMFKLLLLR